MKKIYFFLVMLVAVNGVLGQTTYTWNSSTSVWTTTTAWTPTRTTPAIDDILIFSSGTTVTPTLVPTQTIGQLSVSGSTIVNLQAGGTVTLTISGTVPGVDLSVASGSQLNFNAINAITLNLATGTTGSISGSMTFSASANTGHRLTAVDASAITFNSGSTFTAGTNFTGSAFGTTNLNSIIFASGSTYIQQAGANPFASTQPASVVVFQTGSLFKLQANLTPSLSGRTYANMEIDFAAATISGTGSAALNIDNLTITQGSLSLGMTGAFNIKGNISVASGATLNFNPASASTITLNGTSTQTISNSGTLTFNSNETVNVSKPSGSVVLNTDVQLANLIISSGSFLDLNGKTLAVNGNMSNGGTLTTSLGTVDFAGTSGTQILTTGGSGAGHFFYVLTHSGASTLQLLTNNLKVINNFTNNSGPFNANGFFVNIGGDLSVNGTYASGGGTLTFDGSSGQNWSGAGGNNYGNVVINKSSGNAVLGGNVQVNNLTLTSGKVVLGANNLVAGSSVTGGTSSNYIVTDGTGVLTINNVAGARTFPIGNAKYNPLIINNADGYNWSTKVADGLTADPGFNTNKAVLLTWDISPSVNPTATGTTVTFQYDEAHASLGGQTGESYDNSETVQAWHRPGLGWVMTGSAVLPGGVAGATTVSVSGLQGFSPYALSNSSSPLPVKFSNVKAYQQGSSIRIDWSNLAETNVLNYIAERSANGISFGTISTTAALRNDGGRADYSSLDVSPLIGINFYRIRSNEQDGKTLYSAIVKVNTKGGPAGIVIYPNPVTGGQISLQSTGLNKGKYTVRIFNAGGQQVYNQLMNHTGGAATEVIQLPAALKPGMYNLQLSGGDVTLEKSFIIR